MIEISDKTVGRLTLYRRILGDLALEGVEALFSHELAAKAGITAAQVRRDLMTIGYEGSPQRGYDASDLLSSLENFLDEPGGQSAAMIGVGNLGRALLAYFAGRRPHLDFVAAFDVDPEKTNRVIHGCRCYSLDELEEVVRREKISVAILAVPAESARGVAERVGNSGVQGILNFAPVPLEPSPDLYVENIDLTMSLDKVAFFGRPSGARGILEKGSYD